MPKYYRFQNEAPRVGEVVHCYTDKTAFLKFVNMMKRQDPDFACMRLWELGGQFINHDEGDAVIRVLNVKRIQNI
jgi:hypothetical protein